MCEMASFIFRPVEDFPVKVWVLDDHSATREHFGVKDTPARDDWREGHYLPSGEIACRVLAGDTLSARECNSAVKARWGTFIKFLNWAFEEIAPDGTYNGDLYLRSLTSAEGLRLPRKCGELYLSSLTSAEGLKLPETC